MAAENLIEVRNCTMVFPGVKALDNVDFTLLAGECHGLVGENGAGKSTLSKCIIGDYRMSEGQLFVKGEEIHIPSYTVRKSHEMGIAIVHQEFQLMEDLNGLENIFIGRYEKRGPIIDWKKLQKKGEELLEYLQYDLDLKVKVKHLRTAEKQIIQLAKALLDNPDVIIFDELTAVLQEDGIQNIFRIIDLLKAKGIGIIYISHRLDEIFECCDRYTVLCDGKYVNSGFVKDIDKGELVKMIIGRELKNVYPPKSEQFGDLLLEIKNFTSPTSFRDVNLEVRAGEVVGISGLLGAGKTELLHAIFGNHKLVSGEVLIKGEPVKIRNPQQAIKYGLGVIPDERRLLGLNMLFNIRDNTTLASMKFFKKWKVFQNHRKEAEAALEINKRLNLRYHSLYQLVNKLSGGNQQKVVIAKWMLRNCDVFLLDEPTRGIDVGAKFEIYSLISELAKAGKGVILVSPELEEIIGLSNRVYVMYEGKIMDVVEGENITQEVIIQDLLGVVEA
ncbi:MAG: sugar ABC transporter ATP-binding protein [Sphaerochaetaceae bacterium]|nr:sugar ABC transporter ATP-binding protein [Spirochaetales bacterium]